MILKNRIRDKMREGGKYCQEVEVVISGSYEDFISNNLAIRAGERLFEIIAQVILDICTMIVSHLPVETPTTYANCIDILGDVDIIPETYKLRYRNIIKMRNLIAHQYGKVDYQILYDALGQICNDFNEFVNYASSWVANLD